eukprot:g2762.t1
MSNKETRNIASVMEGTTNIVSIDLSDNHIGTEGAVSLARILVDNSSVRSFDLSRNLLQGTAAKAFSEALSYNCTLLKLELSYNRIKDFGAVAIAGMIRSNSTLRILSLMYSDIGDQGVEAIANSIKLNRTLQYLDLSGNPIGDKGAWYMGHAIAQNDSVWSVAMSECQIADNGATALFSGVSTAAKRDSSLIHIVRISPGNHISKRVMDEVVRPVLSSQSVVRRTSKDASRYSLRSDDRLMIYGLPSGDDGTRILLVCMLQSCDTESNDRSAVRSLEMKHCYMDEKVVQSLSVMLLEGSQMGFLEELILSSNTYLSRGSLESLMNAVAKSRTLKRLTVDDIRFLVADKSIDAIANLIRSETSAIEELRMRRAGIGCEEAAIICAALKTDT